MKIEPQSPWEDIVVNLSCNLTKIRISEKDKFVVTIFYFLKTPRTLNICPAYLYKGEKTVKLTIKENNIYKNMTCHVYFKKGSKNPANLS